MKAKIFLTGSTGYVGTKFVEMYGSQFEILGVSMSDKEHPIDLQNFKRLKQFFENFKPDFVLHLAADTGRDLTTSGTITITNPAITKNLVELALKHRTPFIFTSTEAVYGDREDQGNYIETDTYKPRNIYAESKIKSEEIVMNSGLPYLITRGHRHVGFSRNFHKPKQFPDALEEIFNRKTLHLDSQKIFTPVLINNACDIFVHYIKHDSDQNLLINIGIDQATTFYDLMIDVAKTLGIESDLIKPDGNEVGWPSNSSLSVKKLSKLKYPTISYEEMLEIIKVDVEKSRR